jgi:hypothetical protein
LDHALRFIRMLVVIMSYAAQIAVAAVIEQITKPLVQRVASTIVSSGPIRPGRLAIPPARGV